MKKSIILLLTLAMVFALAACGDAKTSGSSASPAADTDAIYAIGQAANVDGCEMTVTNVEKSTGGEYDKPQSDANEFVIVTVSIANKGKKNLPYNPFYFKMQNSQGQITDTTFTTVAQSTALNSGELAPGGTVSGTVVFEQPKDDAGLVLQYQDNAFADGSKLQFKCSSKGERENQVYCNKCGKEIADGSTFCPECGATQEIATQTQASPAEPSAEKVKGETAKLVIGIISMVLFLIIALQSCVAGFGNALADNGEISGSAGFMLAIFMMIAGIVAVATRKKHSGNMACFVLYLIGGLLGITNAGSYKDLNVWAVLCFIFGAVFLVFYISEKKSAKAQTIKQNQ